MLLNQKITASNTFSVTAEWSPLSVAIFNTLVTGAPSQLLSSVSSCGMFTLCLLRGLDGFSSKLN